MSDLGAAVGIFAAVVLGMLVVVIVSSMTFTVTNNDGTLTISPNHGKVVASLATPVLLVNLQSSHRTIQTFSASASTASVSAVMAGLGGTFTFTPTRTGEVEFFLCGSMYNTVVGDGARINDIYYGTGTAPANGAAVTGTAMGTKGGQLDSSFNGGANTPFCIAGWAGLVVSTTYWFDLSIQSVGGGTSQFAGGPGDTFIGLELSN